MSGILTSIQYFEYTFLYIALVFIGIAKRQYITIIINILLFSYYKLPLNNALKLQYFYFTSNPTITMAIIDYTFVFWIRYIKIKFVQLNAVLQSMLTTTIDSPQHKRVLRMKDNWEDDSSLSSIYRIYKTNENLMKLKKVKQIHLELIKCARIINEAYGLQILTSIRNFILQLLQNRLTFTACGFFDLDHTLIYSSIGLITTYLVILLQVGDKPRTLLNDTNYNSTSMI
ncbi:putative gustatory receptor 28b [Vespula squamosa]|uniref:Gustatory receptor 28b n=1 Tax=Vespula squamosa TaxID=30214 RepID=A0ABD2AYC7_VESSQ